MKVLVLFLATLFLAYTNGANDNFKGVATLFGSKTVPYRQAIAWATLTTFLGSLGSILLAGKLLKNFSGKGLVPDAIALSSEFHLAVALATGATILLATLTGFPVSTTHGLTGALVGAGLIAIGGSVNFTALGNAFVLPLLLSPIFAIALGNCAYRLFRYLRTSLGIQKEWCLCVGEPQRLIPVAQTTATTVFQEVLSPGVIIDSTENCVQQYKERYRGQYFGIQNQTLIDGVHFLSAGVVSFARGLNDTPKIVALLLIGETFSIAGAMLAIALGMAVGGLLNAKKVARTMSQKITAISHSQGLSANLATGILVIAASQYGLPVSTTHVSVGTIFGVGLVAGKVNLNVFYQILLSWLLTLPISAVCSAILYWLLTRP
jgi:inorganic phosphate transporter, PiT family